MATTFRADLNEELDTSVIIDDSLPVLSTMESVMDEGDVLSDLDVTKYSIGDYKCMIKKKSGSKIALKWDRYRKLTVGTLICIKNVDTDYIIILKRIVK